MLFLLDLFPSGTFIYLYNTICSFVHFANMIMKRSIILSVMTSPYMHMYFFPSRKKLCIIYKYLRPYHALFSDNVSPDLHPGGDNLQNTSEHLPIQHPNHQTHRSNSFFNQWRCGESDWNQFVVCIMKELELCLYDW